MKKLIMLLVSALILTTSVIAQEAESARKQLSPEEKARMMTKRLDQKLDLTDAQEAKVLELNLAHARKKAELKNNTATDKSAKMEQMKAIRADIDRQLQSILTPEQWAKKQQMDAERKEKHGKNKGTKENKGTNKK